MDLKTRSAIAEYQGMSANPYEAAQRRYINKVIEPHETRPRLVSALLAARNKRETRPSRKRGNTPL